MRTHCCRHIVAHDVSWAAQTGKHLLPTQNVSEQNQKHFCVQDTKFVSATNVARAGKRGNICVGNNVSTTMCPRLPGPLVSFVEKFSSTFLASVINFTRICSVAAMVILLLTGKAEVSSPTKKTALSNIYVRMVILFSFVFLLFLFR